MPKTATHKYIPRIEQRENNLFVEEYYSSTDTKIILDDVEQTEIGYISYSLQEQLKPLYGYSSRTYDDVAIGNRIVTGMFKVPIKNPEQQTSKDEIIHIHGGADPDTNVNEDYNSEEDKLKGTVEWINSSLRDVITGGGTVYHPDANDVDNEMYVYVNKMESLGLKDRYGNKISMSSSEESIKSAIQLLQSENNLDDATGLLTEQTKDLIDSMIYEKWTDKEEVTVPMGTKVYLGPSTDYAYSTMYADRDAYVIDRSQKGWIQIQIKDGGTGWVQTQTE